MYGRQLQIAAFDQPPSLETFNSCDTLAAMASIGTEDYLPFNVLMEQLPYSLQRDVHLMPSVRFACDPSSASLTLWSPCCWAVAIKYIFLLLNPQIAATRLIFFW